MSGQSRNQRAAFRRWLVGRPGVIQALARTLKPWNVYRIRSTGQHVQLVSFSGGGTVTVDVIGHDDQVQAMMASLFPLQVFGLKLSDLEKV